MTHTNDVQKTLDRAKKAKQQALRFAKVASKLKDNIFIERMAVMKILSHLLKAKRITASQAAELRGISDLDEFKKRLKEFDIIMDWTGHMGDTPKFTYPKSAMIDGSGLSNGGKVKVLNPYRF
jgi:hypothetical protein